MYTYIHIYIHRARLDAADGSVSRASSVQDSLLGDENDDSDHGPKGVCQYTCAYMYVCVYTYLCHKGSLLGD
jgi:hypothetical protein